MIDLLIILVLFTVPPFGTVFLGKLPFTFVTASCRCHPPSMVITLSDDALWVQSSDGRFFVPMHAGRSAWRHFVEVPEGARSSPAIVRLDVADDVDLTLLIT